MHCLYFVNIANLQYVPKGACAMTAQHKPYRIATIFADLTTFNPCSSPLVTASRAYREVLKIVRLM